MCKMVKLADCPFKSFSQCFRFDFIKMKRFLAPRNTVFSTITEIVNNRRDCETALQKHRVYKGLSVFEEYHGIKTANLEKGKIYKSQVGRFQVVISKIKKGILKICAF